MNGLHSVGPSVLLSGDAARIVLESMLIAAQSRRSSGLPITAAHRAIAQELAAVVSPKRQCDVAPEPITQHGVMQPTVTVEDAARRLGLSRRQTQRLAPKLGGRIIAGRWLLDEHAIEEHQEGR